MESGKGMVSSGSQGVGYGHARRSWSVRSSFVFALCLLAGLMSLSLPALSWALPDGRMWELVSPPTKDGALILPIEDGGGLVQASEEGGAITYLSVGPTKSAQEQEEPPAGNADESQVLSLRNAMGGWYSRDIATPHQASTGAPAGAGQEYKWFSPDLSVSLAQPFGPNVPLSFGVSEKTLYVRDNKPLLPEAAERTVYDEAEHEAADPEHEAGYLPLVTGCPLEVACDSNVERHADVPSGTKFANDIGFVGATNDLSNVILHSINVPLTADTPNGNPTKEGGLYEWTAGEPSAERLQLVSVLPEGDPAGEQASGAARLGNSSGEDARDAISTDGSRIIWSYTESYNHETERPHLFMRDVTSEQTVRLDAVDGGKTGESLKGAQFQFATSDGSKVFFTDEEPLTSDSTAKVERPDLYECEMIEEAARLGCNLSDLTVSTIPTHETESADVLGVVLAGSSESAYVYFAANGVLTTVANSEGEEAAPGDCGGNKPPPGATCNLYMRHYNEGSGTWEAPVFVATLSGEDYPDWEGTAGNLEKVTSRVSPDGKYLVFMSEQSLTGYNNTDVASGEPDEEVYLYQASADRSVCVSCNPTGERPTGVLDFEGARGGAGLLADQQGIWDSGRWLAGSVPGWTAMSLSVADYQSRYLSDSGRVFFDSSDALVPLATNGLMDVYEYEPAESSSKCTKLSPTFSGNANGCIGLISSGSSGEESAFLDASGKGPDGEEAEDVFFLTAARLVPADKDSAFDVYDAHVCGATAPCSKETVPPPACATTDSCRGTSTPQASIFGANGSATFSGSGNLVQSQPAKMKCSKDETVTKGKCVKKKGKQKKTKTKKVGHNHGNKR